MPQFWAKSIQTFLKFSRNFQGKIIFILLVVSSINLLWLAPSLWTILFAIYVFIRICYLGQKKLIIFCFLCSIFSFIYFGLLKKQEENAIRQLQPEKVIAYFSIAPDTIRINGNSLQLEGTAATGEKNLLFYQLGNQEEKDYWLNRRQWQKITVSAVFEIPRSQRNLNGFDYQNFLRKNKIYRIVTVEKIQKVVPETIFLWLNPIKKIREWRQNIRLHIEKNFSELTAVYLKSLLLGVRESDFQELKEDWQSLGVIHLFAISGIYVSFFSSIFRYCLLRLGVTYEFFFWFEILFFLLFLNITGFSTGVGRSIFQSVIRSSNKQFNWQLSSLDCWSLSLLLVFLFRPYVLLSTSGQLSFGLAFFLIYIPLFLENIRNRLVRVFLFSTCLTMVSLPFIWFHFHTWNILSVVLSVLLFPFFSQVILPMLTLLLISSYLVGGLNDSLLFKYIEHFFMIFQEIIRKISEVNVFQQITGKIAIWQFVLAICLLLTIFSSKDNLKMIVLSLSLFFSISLGKYFNPQGMFAIVDVGQGESLFLQLPFNRGTYLIDTGGAVNFLVEGWAQKKNQRTNAEKTLLPFLKSRGVDRLDRVFITHGDWDHFGDLLTISKKIQINNITYTEGTEQRPRFNKMLNSLKQQGVTAEAILSGLSFNLQKDIWLSSLYPIEEGQGENNDSLVLLANLKNKKLLLTGDLEASEKAFLRMYPRLVIDILKVGHHGSRTSTSKEFIRQLRPKEGIISNGLDNRYGHPHIETIEKLAEFQVQVSRTDKNGMVYYTWNDWSSKLSKQKKIHSN